VGNQQSSGPHNSEKCSKSSVLIAHLGHFPPPKISSPDLQFISPKSGQSNCEGKTLPGRPLMIAKTQPALTPSTEAQQKIFAAAMKQTRNVYAAESCAAKPHKTKP
jgi:hypothetical protein